MEWQNINTSLITGASGGIGKAFVLYCARMRHQLVLVDKDAEALEHLAHWVRKNFHVVVHTQAIDITSAEGLKQLSGYLEQQDLSIDWLINNAGIGHTSLFSQANADQLRSELAVNVTGTTMLTHEALPFMNRKRRSYILFLSSLASFYPLPLKNSYGASKSYITQLGQSLRYELEPENISVSVCCPGFVNSNLHQSLNINRLQWTEKWMAKEPDEIVEAAIRGMLKNKHIIIPGQACRLLYYLTRMMPSFLRTSITRNRFHALQHLMASQPLIPGHLT